ncbi:MAG TPA: hypothetical protein VEA99_07835 [Gemmatimonadaceae bacterium]|nr:hypothetical protein [Gemmatimonadaceae bacterium]
MLASRPLQLALVACGLHAAPAARAQQPASRPALPRGVSVAADFAVDLSPDGPTLRDSSRFAVREVEAGLAGSIAGFQAALLVRARDGTRVALHQAFVSGRLPGGIEARVGRLALPFGHLNETHGHALPSVEPPYPHLRYVGQANVSGTGVSVARALGRRVTLTLAAVDRVHEDTTQRRALDLPNQFASGLGYLGRLTGDLRVAGIVARLDASAMTSLRLQPLSERVSDGTNVVDAVLARQAVTGAELLLVPADSARRAAGWLVAAQALWQLNERESSLRGRIPSNPATGGPFYLGPIRDVAGVSAMARMPLGARLTLVARGDRVEESDFRAGTTTAGSAVLEWRAPAGGRLSAGYEALRRPGLPALDRVVLRGRVAAGEHGGWPD